MSYRIQFSFDAQVRDFVSDETVSLRVADLSICDETMENYLSMDLADRGIVGGEVTLTANKEKAIVTIAFWAPGLVDDSVLNDLLTDTRAQLQDGMGEGGFAFHHEERLLVAMVDIDSEPMRSIASDQREVLPPPSAAVAARSGDFDGLKTALQMEPTRIDAPFQGYSALHYAIIVGNPAMAQLLIEAGADVNRLTLTADSPLMLCAVANQLNDEQAEAVARLLIGKGARVQLRDDAGRTAKSLAELRGKPRLAALLG